MDARTQISQRNVSRVPCTGWTPAAVFVSFEKNQPLRKLNRLGLNSVGNHKIKPAKCPKQFIHYFEEDNRPQAKLDRNLEGGMAVSVGRLREDKQYDYKFVGLSHNTLRGAAGELYC